MDNYMINAAIAATVLHFTLANIPASVKQSCFFKYIEIRNFFFGDPHAPRKPYVETVELFPDQGDDLYTLYSKNRWGIDVSDSLIAHIHLQTPFEADYDTVWKILSDGADEFYGVIGRIVVKYRDAWGQENYRVYPELDSGNTPLPFVTLPLHTSKYTTSDSVVHAEVSMYAPESVMKTEDGKKEVTYIKVFSDAKSTGLFKKWVRRKADFTYRACAYALADYVHENEDALEILEANEKVNIKLVLTFSDLNQYTHQQEVRWPLVDFTREYDADSEDE